ncbi:MAG: helix-turn-helix transcriptional regulator [Ignavibacteriales bacterium]|nr:helix-turn-helix transcriptional regulator [Ignavibacteriales bacterium]
MKKPVKEEAVSRIGKLTGTEKQILKQLSQNKTSTQIAKEMFVSYRTVQNHRLNISQKLNLHGYNTLLQFALEHKEKF